VLVDKRITHTTAVGGLGAVVSKTVYSRLRSEHGQRVRGWLFKDLTNDTTQDLLETETQSQIREILGENLLLDALDVALDCDDAPSGGGAGRMDSDWILRSAALALGVAMRSCIPASQSGGRFHRLESNLFLVILN
jgi:hypothetical protein